MDVKLKPKKSSNYIVTIAIGNKHKKLFNKYSLESWLIYCDRNDIGLICFYEDLISKKDKDWKKPNWQKLLIPKLLKSKIDLNSNICFLDIDILINPYSPNIFDFHIEDKISLVSQEKNLPYNLTNLKKNISFFRHFYYSKDYPLNSAIFMKPNEIYKYHGIDAEVNDYACTGTFIYNLKEFGDFFEQIYFKYPPEVESITGGGEEFHLNYEFHLLNKTNWIDYKFQAIWIFEMGAKYPHLYYSKPINEKKIKESIQSSLISNYFLHFAGSWYESEMYHDKNIIDNKFLKICKELSNYKNQEINYKSHGIIKPN
tara:strand:- start:17097 stop:18038 length:942 start_codon:yes stop_codon:yes gene_type:complete